MSFKEYELGEICEIRKGISLGGKDFKNSGIPILKMKNIQNEEIVLNDLSYCDPINEGKSAIIGYEDVVITTMKPAGKVAINLTNKNLLFTAEIFKIEPNPEILDRRYLYYYLLNNPQEVERHITYGNSSHLYKQSLAKLRIKVPNLEIQKDIAHKLSTFRELKEELHMRKKQHKYYRGVIMNSLR